MAPRSDKRASLAPLQTQTSTSSSSLSAPATRAGDGAGTTWAGTARSSPASPVLTSAHHHDDAQKSAFLLFPQPVSSYSDELDMALLHSRSSGRPAPALSRQASTSSNASREPDSYHRGHGKTYSSSSNPRSATERQSVTISRPASANATRTPSGGHRDAHNYPRSSSRHRSYSPLLADDSLGHHTPFSMADSSSALLGSSLQLPSPRTAQSSSSSSRYRAAASSRLSVPYLLAKLARGKAALGIGTGEWTNPETGKTRIPPHLRAYVPVLIWAAVSIAMAVIVGVWHEDVFAALDRLSSYLKSIGILGDFILFLCIFITTFPPLPLYSTLIILSGYSFGLWEGFAISFTAALSGAVVVFLLSKVWFKQSMQRLLDKSDGFKKVVRAIEVRPRLLWLIRLSPYPYNVMNVLLASSSTLSFSCYFWCTFLSLPKLIVHCAIGTTIRNFAETAKNPGGEGSETEAHGQRMKTIAGGVGALLCIGVFIYILVVARRAIDEVDSERLPSMDDDHDFRQDASYSALVDHRENDTLMAQVSFPSSAVRTSFALEQSPRSPRESNDSKFSPVVHQRQTFERQDTTPFSSRLRNEVQGEPFHRLDSVAVEPSRVR